ncbi:MAG: signal peptidase I [Lentisphaeria bacterium]|nr:signal peptidase I [Lentisphaeria bacterium]
MFFNGEDDGERSFWDRFLFPRFNRKFLVRLLCVATMTFVVFRFMVMPAWTDGQSMIPTYAERQFLPINRMAYLRKAPQPGDVVAVRYIGEKVMFLKRVVAVEGQVVEFRQGYLFVNGRKCEASWAHLTDCDWELEPRIVGEGEVYVIGDNRSMPMEQHIFGHVPVDKIVGKPLF